MIVLLGVIAALPVVMLAQAIWWPGSFHGYAAGAGRAVVIMLTLMHLAVIGVIYWLRFVRISPLMLRLVSAKCCLVGIWTSAIVPWSLFGLSKLRAPGFGELAIEFGDTGLASATALAISLFALNHFSADYERLSRPENVGWASVVPRERDAAEHVDANAKASPTGTSTPPSTDSDGR